MLILCHFWGIYTINVVCIPTGQSLSLAVLWWYGNEAVNTYSYFYFSIFIHYFSSNFSSQLLVPVIYKEGNILNTSSNPTVHLSYGSRSIDFYIYLATERDHGVYEFKWLSGRYSWFTAINIRGQNYHSAIQHR